MISLNNQRRAARSNCHGGCKIGTFAYNVWQCLLVVWLVFRGANFARYVYCFYFVSVRNQYSFPSSNVHLLPSSFWWKQATWTYFLCSSYIAVLSCTLLNVCSLLNYGVRGWFVASENKNIVKINTSCYITWQYFTLNINMIWCYWIICTGYSHRLHFSGCLNVYKLDGHNLSIFLSDNCLPILAFCFPGELFRGKLSELIFSLGC